MLTDLFTQIGIVNLISLALAIFGLYLTYKAMKKSRPLFSISNSNLIKENVEDVSSIPITFKGKKISNLSVARVAIWNAGNETINSADLAQTSPIRVVPAEGIDLLDAKIITAVNPVNRFKCSLFKNGNQRIAIDFDYFDHNEGVLLQVFHTGNNASDLNVLGDLKKVGAVVNIENTLMQKVGNLFGFSNIAAVFDFFPKKYKKPFAALLLLLTPIIPLIQIFSPSIEDTLNNERVLIVMAVIFIIFYWPMAFFLLRRNIPRSLVPNGDKII